MNWVERLMKVEMSEGYSMARFCDAIVAAEERGDISTEQRRLLAQWELDALGIPLEPEDSAPSNE